MKDLCIACVVGARPNFMKMAPLLRALKKYHTVRPVLIHTGQHYDENLSGIFFRQLGMQLPDMHLDVGSNSHGSQTAQVLERFEKVLQSGPPKSGRFDRVVVVGDVNSTMAATLAAAKLCIPVAHIEAGLRSFDRSMPEEINRIVTDAIADMLFVSEPAGVENLLREGHAKDEIHLVGNVMIDTLMRLLPQARARGTLSKYALDAGCFGVITLHRPSNVDQPETLSSLLEVFIEMSERLPLLFPVHPRTRQRIERFGLASQLDKAIRIVQSPPLGYLDFLAVTSQAKVIITDSGGLQEESTALGIPCLTVRTNTERPVTITEGTSTLVGNSPDRLRQSLNEVLDGTYKVGHCPALWDGRAAERIAQILAQSVLGENSRFVDADIRNITSVRNV
jgi:UDP-N-acetylglucosamine 2-epimerase (non-hydrolysing)